MHTIVPLARLIVGHRVWIRILVHIGGGRPPGIFHQTFLPFVAPLCTGSNMRVADVPTPTETCLCFIPNGIEPRLGFQLEIRYRLLDMRHW